jgi:hypothetical protein
LTCLRLTSLCSRCQYLRSQGGRAGIQSPRQAEIRHAPFTNLGKHLWW